MIYVYARTHQHEYYLQCWKDQLQTAERPSTPLLTASSSNYFPESSQSWATCSQPLPKLGMQSEYRPALPYCTIVA